MGSEVPTQGGDCSQPWPVVRTSWAIVINADGQEPSLGVGSVGVEGWLGICTGNEVLREFG